MYIINNENTIKLHSKTHLHQTLTFCPRRVSRLTISYKSYLITFNYFIKCNKLYNTPKGINSLSNSHKE